MDVADLVDGAVAIRQQRPARGDRDVGAAAVADRGIDLDRVGNLRGDVDRRRAQRGHAGAAFAVVSRSEEHTSELQSLMRSSSAVYSFKKTKPHTNQHYT